MINTGMGKDLPTVILPEGYRGKILLIRVSGPPIGARVILRSGDVWHRAILHNTEQEIRQRGWDAVRVFELGGARVRFDPDGSIVIYGGSDDFGACDKEVAAALVREHYPDRPVGIESW